MSPWLQAFLPLLLLNFLQFHLQIEAAKLAKKSGIIRPNEDKMLQFADLDLLKRPLNLYITANGKHAVVLNKTLNNAANQSKSVGGAIDYRIVRPPFLIKQRGAAILLNGGNSLDWHFGYPSLLQMLAASGHATVAMEGNDLAKMREVIGWEELHGLFLLGIGSKGVEQALEAIEKEPRVRNQLDAVLLANVPERDLPRIEAMLGKTPRGNERHLWVLLRKSNTKNLEGLDGNRLKIINVEWDPLDMANSQKLAQISVNLLDFVHPR